MFRKLHIGRRTRYFDRWILIHSNAHRIFDRLVVGKALTVDDLEVVSAVFHGAEADLRVSAVDREFFPARIGKDDGAFGDLLRELRPYGNVGPIRHIDCALVLFQFLGRKAGVVGIVQREDHVDHARPIDDPNGEGAADVIAALDAIYEVALHVLEEEAPFMRIVLIPFRPIFAFVVFARKLPEYRYPFGELARCLDRYLEVVVFRDLSIAGRDIERCQCGAREIGKWSEASVQTGPKGRWEDRREAEGEDDRQTEIGRSFAERRERCQTMRIEFFDPLSGIDDDRFDKLRRITEPLRIDVQEIECRNEPRFQFWIGLFEADGDGAQRGPVNDRPYYPTDRSRYRDGQPEEKQRAPRRRFHEKQPV